MMSSFTGVMTRFFNGGLKKECKVIFKFFYNNAFAYLLLYLQNVLINRYMPAEALGQFSYGQSILTLLTSVYSMEVYSAYLRFWGYVNNQSLLKITRKVLFVASVLFAISAWCFFREPLYILFFGYMWMRERLYFFRSQLKIDTYGRVKICQYLLSIIFLVILIHIDWLNERTMLMTLGVSYLLVSFVYSFFEKFSFYETREDLPVVDTKEIFQYALPLSFNAIVVWLLGAADQMLIDMYLDVATLTYYSVAFRIMGVIRIGTGVIMEYWPRFYFDHMESKDFDNIKKMQGLFLGIVALLSLGCIVFSKQLYWILGASKYSNYTWMFIFLVIAEMFRQWGSIGITFQSFMKNTVINITCLAILGGIKVLINWYYIGDYGVNILFYTTVGCYIIYCLCGLYFGIYRERRYMEI